MVRWCRIEGVDAASVHGRATIRARRTAVRLLLSDADARALAERLGTDVATLHADLCRQSQRKLRSIFIICLVVVLVIAAFAVLSGSVIDLSTVSNFLSERFHGWSTSLSSSHFAHHLGTCLMFIADCSAGGSRWRDSGW
ncbi:conserved hypothetical protein [Xanthomonas citri pv. fuscans]|uniref:Uncharacterized protein n=1 Tax=Xanthomonas campestris pv. phaseoli TaxID=317013 RepID=A0A7Z7NIZ2_XANCH|nr:conserved hypothetical protein [Xanthomonas citri pv. fuscans]SOO25129.1 conserved hypothetical protein [Xanthomonas phaseoli pv. phaseoli]